MLHDATDDLGPGHVAALIAHPDAVRAALAEVADVLSTESHKRDYEEKADTEMIGGGVEQWVAPSEAESRLS